VCSISSGLALWSSTDGNQIRAGASLGYEWAQNRVGFSWLRMQWQFERVLQWATDDNIIRACGSLAIRGNIIQNRLQQSQALTFSRKVERVEVAGDFTVSRFPRSGLVGYERSHNPTGRVGYE
jgi:hypothetical protein